MTRSIILLMFWSYALSANAETDTTTTSQPDSLTSKWVFQATVIATNNGFAPIPAFSFGKPTAFAFLQFRKKRISYAPDFAAGFNGQPWMINNWARYHYTNKRKPEFSIGVNPSLFFKTEILADRQFTSANRNLTLEVAASKRRSLHAIHFFYRYNHAFDFGPAHGHVINLEWNYQVRSGRRFRVGLRGQLVYFNHTGNMDGLFVAGALQAPMSKTPVTLFIQGIQRLEANFPDTPFKWNFGLIGFF